jgi:hypothetical protein
MNAGSLNELGPEMPITEPYFLLLCFPPLVLTGHLARHVTGAGFPLAARSLAVFLDFSLTVKKEAECTPKL